MHIARRDQRSHIEDGADKMSNTKKRRPKTTSLSPNDLLTYSPCYLLIVKNPTAGNSTIRYEKQFINPRRQTRKGTIRVL